jgi:Zn-dependent protease with chaperone function
MTHEEFDKLVKKVEAGVGRQPAALRWRVLQLALLGYAGLLFWLLVIVLLAAAFFAAMYWVDWQGKVICGLAGVGVLFGGGWVALRALLVRVPPPEGRTLARAEAPQLFDLLDALQRELRSVPFHQVLLVNECNAAVVQVPRLGVLGWSRNYLLLGLPLLDGLAPEELRAVLAHEFTHLSRAHGRLTHWLYRLRRSWEEVFKQLSRPQIRGEVSLRPLAVKYLDWFWPRFNAHAFVLSRLNEYEADEQAARVAGAEHVASSLVRLRFLSRQLEDNVWPEILQLANERAEPPDDVFLRLRDGLRAGPKAEEQKRWLEEALRLPTSNHDTHPCLTERLRALGAMPRWNVVAVARAAVPSAAERLLGERLESLRREVQQFWRKEAAPHWRERHARAGALSHRLTSLAQAVPDPSADADSLWDQARALIDLRGDKSVEPLLRRILALRPDHPAANFHLGRLLLEAGNGEGEAYLERVIREDEDALPQACALLHEHHRRAGQPAKVREIEARLDRYEKELAASRKERSEASAGDTFIAHGLTEAELEALRKVLTAEPELVRAELAQKQMRHFPKQKFFVLCAHRRQPWHRLPNRDRDLDLVRRLSARVQLPGRVLVFPTSGSFRALARKLAGLRGAEVWRRTG